jgi:hypothetical protein
MEERAIARAEAAKKAGRERVDDNPITIAKRVKDFRKKNEPVERYLKRHGPFQEVGCLHSRFSMLLMIY